MKLTIEGSQKAFSRWWNNIRPMKCENLINPHTCVIGVVGGQLHSNYGVKVFLALRLEIMVRKKPTRLQMT